MSTTLATAWNSKHRVRAVVLASIVLFYLAPQLLGDSAFKMGQYEVILCFIVVAVALNLAMGYAGQYLMGITAVFACGGYGAAIVAQHHPAHVGLLAMCVISVVFAAATGMIIGLPALRIGGFYLAIVSLFAAVAVPTLAVQWQYVGANSGIALFLVPGFAPTLAGEGLYLMFVSLVLASTFFCWAIVNSRVGHRFAVLETSDQLAAAVGVSGYRTKLLVILTSSALAGLAGGMYVYSQQFIAPSSTSVSLAILLVASVVIGGMGTLSGPIVGGIIVLGINQFLTSFQQYNGFVFGGSLLLFAVFLPHGLIPRLRSRRARAAELLPVEDVVPDEAAPAKHGVDQDGMDAPVSVEGELIVHQATRSFGGIAALDHVDVTVKRGTIHGLIGSNGSGKTTLLNLICGFYSLDEGDVMIDGDDLSSRPYRVTRSRVARTFQTPKLMLKATALANVIPAAELRIRCTGIESVLRLPRGRRASRKARERAMAALDEVGLASIADELAGSLPHGTRRLVELARAIAMEPHYLLLDEPAAGLSVRELDQLVVNVLGLAQAGVGVLLIEHNVPTVLEIAQEVTVLHQGKCIFSGSPSELVADAEVANAFLGVDLEQLEVTP